MRATYKHTSIVARDWRALAGFYQDVFGCVPVLPTRALSGAWLERGTGVAGARIAGIHLRLPGFGEAGPTLEIFEYAHNEPRPATAANREGIAHLAFGVDDVEQVGAAVLAHGGSILGKITSADVDGVGRLTFVYCADPEGNVVELQSSQ